MKFAEIIECGSQDREKDILPRFFIDTQNIDLLERRGNSILGRAHIPELFDQLGNLLREEGEKDILVELGGRLMEDGTVGLMLRWDPEGQCGPDLVYKAVIAQARPLTGDVIIKGREAELIEAARWRRNKQIIAEAIADAYRNPTKVLVPLNR